MHFEWDAGSVLHRKLCNITSQFYVKPYGTHMTVYDIQHNDPHQPYVDTLYVLTVRRRRPKLVLTGTSIPLCFHVINCSLYDLASSSANPLSVHQYFSRRAENLCRSLKWPFLRIILHSWMLVVQLTIQMLFQYVQRLFGIVFEYKQIHFPQ